MKNPIELLEEACQMLQPLIDQLVFTGGATIGLYLNEEAALDVRATNDVDCVCEIVTRKEYYQLGEQLRQLGFQEAIEGPTCRWTTSNGLIIDVMPTEPKILGFSNRWYRPALQRRVEYTLPSGQKIFIFAAFDLLAAKIEAFQGRGNGDFYGSADFEDIITLLDGRTEILSDLGQSPVDVRKYIADWFNQLQNKLRELGTVHLSYAARQAGREQKLLEKIDAIASGTF